jgi:hypothetical protein
LISEHVSATHDLDAATAAAFVQNHIIMCADSEQRISQNDALRRVLEKNKGRLAWGHSSMDELIKSSKGLKSAMGERIMRRWWACGGLTLSRLAQASTHLLCACVP